MKQVSAETGPSEMMPETVLSRCQKSAVFCPNAQNPGPVLFLHFWITGSTSSSKLMPEDSFSTFEITLACGKAVIQKLNPSGGAGD